MSSNNKKNKKNRSTPSMEGIIYIASNGTGYVDVEEFDQDVQIQPRFLNTAMHGDKVKIALLPKSKRDTRTQGEVVEVLERARHEIVGTIDKQHPKKNFAFLIPDDTRIHTDIFIHDARDKKIKHNHKALVRITDWGRGKKGPAGEVIKMLGKKGKNDVEMLSILLDSGYRPDFPKEAIKQAEQIQNRASAQIQKEKNSRKNYTDIPTITIDPSDAKDLDDALSVRKIEGGIFEVGIHIADVSYYVKENSPLDMQARGKGNSVYLVDRTIPMFPEILSNDLCSLNPGEDKLAFSAILKITKNGQVKDRWFGKTVINPDKRFSYEQAQKVIDAGKGECAQELKYLDELAKIFQKQREERGALTFEQEEVQFELDKNGRPVRIYQKDILEAHKLIEEFMILANREVATYFSKIAKKRNSFGIYRVHDAPRKKNIDELLDFLNTLGYDLKAPGKSITTKQLNSIFKAVKGKEEEQIVETAAMQDMEKAVYSVENRGHYGLALKNYTHFTSPIRRYADLMVHRILQTYLSGNAPQKGQLKKYKKILKDLTKKEINAMQAERDSIKYKQIEYMLERKGEIFEGIIISVFNWGMFVQEKNTKAEGLVRTRDMQDDYYILDEDAYAIVGTNNKKRYSIGDMVKVKVKGGDPEQKMLDFVLK
ncbi:MAG: ribonuclease R [Candidatus Spechtbacterales bacterium]|nr:ribonuclease R [Candidatus Spechtbacterales bacterium]